jgi:RimJ/RimL family protein N-acetyltransferase
MRVFRKLHPFEQWRLAEHLARLSPEDRRRRFFAGVSDDAIQRHCRRIDWLGTVVIGCFEAGVLRGAAELRLETGTLPFAGELALSVETAWQNQGVGTELVRRTLLAAGNRGLASLQMVCLAENHRMQRIAQKHARRLASAGGETEAALAVPLPTQLSLVEEAVAEGIGLLADCWSTLARAA